MFELHEEICDSHVREQTLMLRVIRVGYFWPIMKKDCLHHVKKYDQCQRQGDWHQAPPEILHSINIPWSFHTWGIDISDPFPLAAWQMKFLIVAVEYFTKWIEIKLIASIITIKVKKCI